LQEHHPFPALLRSRRKSCDKVLSKLAQGVFNKGIKKEKAALLLVQTATLIAPKGDSLLTESFPMPITSALLLSATRIIEFISEIASKP
jgi:hypothetical protein